MIMPLETASSSNLKIACCHRWDLPNPDFDDGIQLLAEIRAADEIIENKLLDCLASQYTGMISSPQWNRETKGLAGMTGIPNARES